MKETRLIMGMPVTVSIADKKASQEDLEAVFSYLNDVDQRFSTYKNESEIMKINRKEISEYSDDMKEIFALADKTQKETNGFFNINRPDGLIDPSGIVKGWAIKKSSDILIGRGQKNFYVNVGGDIQVVGKNEDGEDWSVGIRNPFNKEEIVKVVYPRNSGIATSGVSERGGHIYNPFDNNEELDELVSLTVIGKDVLEADRFATAAFAMGRKGLEFIELTPNLEAYGIDRDGMATMTTGFPSYTNK